jgi:hypothetical protein
MSLASSLLAFLPAILGAKTVSARADRISIEGLKRDLDAARARVDQLLARGDRLQMENDCLRRQRDDLRMRLEALRRIDLADRAQRAGNWEFVGGGGGGGALIYQMINPGTIGPDFNPLLAQRMCTCVPGRSHVFSRGAE